MAFLMKKCLSQVFKSVTSKGDDSKTQVACPTPAPMCPPTPELTTLTPEELIILRDVFRRQEQFEKEESERIRKISNDLQQFEMTVNRQSELKQKLQHVDLRLCRLCYKTKFVDGIGRMCHDCHKRVCTKCGSFTKYRRDLRKNKSVRGKWRCNMCQMKRDTLCKTGSWYHRTSPIESETNENNAMVKLKTSLSFDNDSENSESQNLACDTETDALPSGNRTDPELYRPLDNTQDSIKGCSKKSRRRSLPVGHVIQSGEEDDDDDDELENNGDHLKRERMLFLQKRQLRKLKKRQFSNQTSEEDAGALPSECSDQEVGNSFEINSCSEDLSKPFITFDVCAFPPVQNNSQTDISMSKLSLESASDSSSVLSYATKESSLSDSTESPLLNRIKRQNAVYGSSSSSVFSDTKHSDSQGGASSPSSVRHLVNRDTASAKTTKDPMFPEPKHDIMNRRITLSKCECIIPTDKEHHKRLSSIKPHHPHEIILHKDKNDHSRKTNGLGMRIIGGMHIDAILGAYVVMVTRGGPADVQGHIKEGDQILQWNGQSLTNVTFEEARTIMDNSGDVVQLIVRHRHRAVGSQDGSPEHRVTRLVSADLSCMGKGGSLDTLPYMRPRRRMLPKTPIEIKKETRKITGQVLVKMSHSSITNTLTVSVLKAKELSTPERRSYDVPNPYALIHMLPKRRLYTPTETNCVDKTRTPEWKHVCRFEHISEEKLSKRSIEITVWNRDDKEDLFMGEVLLDLSDVSLDEDFIWYQLEDHDDNSSPLPERKHSVPEVVKLTTFKSLDDPRMMNSPAASPKESRRSLPPSPPERSNSFKSSPVVERRMSGITPPRSPVLSITGEPSSPQKSSFTRKMKRRVVSAVSRVSSSLTVLDKRDIVEEEPGGELHRSRSFCEESGHDVTTSPRQHKRRTSAHFDLLAPPRPLSRANSSSSFYESDDLSDQASWHTISPVDRPPPDGDDITSLLGPAQVPPKPAAENLVCGDVRLGFIVSKGHLEIDVVKVRGFDKSESGIPPDAYVKTYLIEGSKVIQKKKTQIVKAAGESNYRRKVKYSACNIHGRYMKINIWMRCKGFEKKRCLGEAVVKLDNLDLTQQTVSWYKLFPLNMTEFGSDESLYHW